MRLFFCTTLLLLVGCFSTAYASILPTFTFTQSANQIVTVSIHGDPESSVELHYGSGASLVATIGWTDSNGNFSAPLSATSYNMGCEQTAYVLVAARPSPTIPWVYPGTACSSIVATPTNISFSRNNVVLSLGQNQIVTVSGTGGYSIGNPNPSIIGASISGSIITLSGLKFGGSNINVCESDGQCALLYVVSLPSSYLASAVPAPICPTSPAPTASTPPVQTPVATVSKYIFSNLLSLNAVGNEVTELQKRLTALGFYSGPITGKFGALTEAAVKALQKANNMAAVGYVGPGTRAILNK